MKLNRYSLRTLIESIIQEEKEADASKFKSSGKKHAQRALRTINKVADDNKLAVKVQNPEDVKKRLGVKFSGDYYAWKGNNTETGYQLGSFRYSKGDPYTYEAVGGGYYRVMSGPDSNKKRDNGKRIGTTPIGAKFKPKSPPKNSVEELVDFGDVFKSDPPTITGKKSSDLIDLLIADLRIIERAVADGDRNKAKKRLTTMQSMINLSLDDKGQRRQVAQEYAALFAPGVQSKGTIISNLEDLKMCLEMIDGTYDSNGLIQQYLPNVEYADIPDAKPGEGNAARKDSDGSSRNPMPGESIMEPANESFSRGSLLRRRYRRY